LLGIVGFKAARCRGSVKVSGRRRERSNVTQSQSIPSSSLEALQKGTLGAAPADSALKDIRLDFDRYDLRGDALVVLKANAGRLKAHPSVHAEIEGHADEQGTNEYNLALGAKRSDSVKRYLVDMGIAPNRFSIVSYGEELPICTEHTEPCRAMNRRAHFAVEA
jgi:peptidoglycan-associated lipoprotein